MVIPFISFIIYPLVRHSFLLSSSTVFMFSIQTASTGPSNVIHLLWPSYSDMHLRMSRGSTPSDHDLDIGSRRPYRESVVIDLGFSRIISVLLKSFYTWVDRILARTLAATVFPDRVWPTSITPCLTLMIAHSC